MIKINIKINIKMKNNYLLGIGLLMSTVPTFSMKDSDSLSNNIKEDKNKDMYTMPMSLDVQAYTDIILSK